MALQTGKDGEEFAALFARIERLRVTRVISACGHERPSAIRGETKPLAPRFPALAALAWAPRARYWRPMLINAMRVVTGLVRAD